MGSSLFQILHISRQDMLSRMTDLDILAGNLANVNTAGFKSTRANFQELLAEGQRSGVHLSSTQMNAAQGNLQTTTNPLDWAIQGEGLFAISLPGSKTAYTRDGHFHLDADNRIVTGTGNPLIWQGQVPPGAEEIQVQPDGVVQVRVGATWTQAGTVQLARFSNTTALQSTGDNLWVETPASGKVQMGAPGTTGFGVIAPNSIEQSNVNIGEEMTHMMTLQRSFQMSLRTFQQTDEMITEAIHMRKV